MGIGAWELVLFLLIALLLFGTTRLRSIGSDLGAAMRSFRGAMNDPGEGPAMPPRDDTPGGNRPS